MGHTPGPWKVISEEWKSLSIHGSDDRFIADVSLHYDTAESNARLIAAAPDLLAALEGLIEQADDPDNASNDDLVDMIDWTGIRAAIAKAKGV